MTKKSTKKKSEINKPRQTVRKIRGEKRIVRVWRDKNGKEKVRVVSPRNTVFKTKYTAHEEIIHGKREKRAIRQIPFNPMKPGETRIGYRKIRGEVRQVGIRKDISGKEHIRLMHQRKDSNIDYRDHISKSYAKLIHANRSKKARTQDEKTTSKRLIRDSRWVKKPGMYDYPGVDTKQITRNTEIRVKGETFSIIGGRKSKKDSQKLAQEYKQTSKNHGYKPRIRIRKETDGFFVYGRAD